MASSALVQAQAAASVGEVVEGAGAVSGGEGVGGRRLVAVVKAPDADGTCQEIVTRIVAELMAEGVPVVALTCSGADPACLTFSGTSVSAIVLVERHDNIRAVEVRAGGSFGSGRTGPPSPVTADFTRIQRVANLESGGGAAALAVRTVELLRAMLIEVADIADAEGAPVAAPAAAVEQKADPPEHAHAPADATAQADSTLAPMGAHNVTVNVGASVIGGFAKLQAAYGPMLTVGRRTSDHVLLSVMLAGPAFAPDQRNVGGRVSIRHEMALLSVDILGLFWRRLVLRAGIGAGVYHIHVEGEAAPVPPTLIRGGLPSGPETFPVGRGAGGFAALLSWSAGVVANFSSRMGVFVDGRIFVLTPTPVVLLNGFEVGRAGNPGVAVTTGVELRF